MQGIYVYNPYTFEELIEKLSEYTIGYSVDDYLQCLSSDAQKDKKCAPMRPKVEYLNVQGVSTLAVLQKCRTNYQQKQWDQAAYLLYDPILSKKLLQGPVTMFERIGRIQSSVADTGKCLLHSNSMGEGNSGCMLKHMQNIPGASGSSEQFFIYDTNVQEHETSLTTDACMVFTGPAQNEELSVGARTLFSNCTGDTVDKNCLLAPYIWAGSSQNNVPVAVPHLKVTSQYSVTIFRCLLIPQWVFIENSPS